MIIFDNTYTYPKLERVQTDQGRFYKCPNDELLPSVTTILSRTQSQDTKDGLDNWRNWIGHDKAKVITDDAAALGTIIHNSLEKHLLGQELKFGSNHIYRMADVMVKTMIAQGVSKIQKVYGLESALYYSGLYSGTADLIVGIDNKMMIGDFKNSRKMKKDDHVTDYLIQVLAYSLCHDNMYGTKIRDCKIMLVARPNKENICDYKEFDITPLNYDKYYDLWMNKLEQYYSLI